VESFSKEQGWKLPTPVVDLEGFVQDVSSTSNSARRAGIKNFCYKTAAVRAHTFTDEAQLRANVFDYIEVFYNRFRKHASLGYLSPA